MAIGIKMDDETRKMLLNLRRTLRCKATKERKKVGRDVSRIEGWHKGRWLAFEEAASHVDKLLRS